MRKETSNELIAVLGAAGQTGISVLGALQRAKPARRLRALVRDESKIGACGADVEYRVAELTDRAGLADALGGVGTLYYIPPVFDDREGDFIRNVIAAAMAAGVERIVYHSVLHAATPEMPHHARKAEAERELRHSALEWTIVQPAMYMQTPLIFLQPDKGMLAPGFDVTRPFNPIDLEDIGEAVANVLVQPGHGFATYELAGVEQLSFTDMAAILSQVLDRKIVARKVAAEDIRISRLKKTLSARQKNEMGMMMAHYDKHGLVGNGNVLRMLLDREPTTFLRMATRTYDGEKHE